VQIFFMCIQQMIGAIGCWPNLYAQHLVKNEKVCIPVEFTPWTC